MCGGALLYRRYRRSSGEVGKLPLQLAAMNMSNIGTQLLTIDAAVTKDRQRIYQAAMMEPHTAAELNIDDIRSMCDELIEPWEYMASV